MFIHLGGDEVIRSKDVIAILDYDSNEADGITVEFLQAKSKQDVIIISEDLTKSVVVTESYVYYSPISSLTLKRRAQVISEFEDYTENEEENTEEEK
ncbi:extracellular matrix regulator RemB [Salsuginibacillus kocurii]|uniref:extracellular matrix regulator RemB n=1 Tax=Salsuginibacillus kocurii TaxID=427078 RepID=UPI000361F3D5|nr:extracellular matrix/biofilm biosynthesis regulator RemA family protein [Salsuginibacillus kocurii]